MSKDTLPINKYRDIPGCLLGRLGDNISEFKRIQSS